MGRLSNIPLTLVETWEDAERFRSWLGERRPVLGFDLETSGLFLAKDHIRLAQFGDGTHGWALSYRDWRGLIKQSIEEYRGPIVATHLKFDASFAERDGIHLDWSRAHDTIPMCFLSNSMGPKGLKPAAAIYVDSEARAGQAELKAAFARYGWDYGTIPIRADLPVYWAYGASDPVLSALLAEDRWQPTQEYRESYDLEMACQKVLCDMELRGVRIDVPYCENQLDELSAQLEELLRTLPLNPNAPHQVRDALQSLGVTLVKRTSSGELAVDDEVLRGLVDSFTDDQKRQPIPLLATLVMEARDLQKLVSSFFGNFLRYRDDDILHPHFNQLAARTGRMSISEPALQQVPKNELVRNAFIPREGNRLILADYDNQELRVAAHVSRDPAMLEAFRENRDLHSELAAAIYEVALDAVTKKQRGTGKKGRFSKLYGAGVPKFARSTGLTEAQAMKVFTTISQMYPQTDAAMLQIVRTVKQRAAEEGRETGWVKLFDGRKLRVPKEKAYIGLNYVIQGSCAVVMKQALVDLDRVGLGEYLGLSIHDEVTLDVPAADAVEIAHLVEDTMLSDHWAVPLTAHAKIVDRWGEAYREDG